MGLIGALPARVTPEQADLIDDWSGCRPPERAFRRIASAGLPPFPSWNPSTRAWGSQDGDLVEVLYDGGDVASVHVRVDVRAVNRPVLCAIVALAKLLDCAILTEDLKVMEPSVADLLAEIRSSPEAEFVADPAGFLHRLTQGEVRIDNWPGTPRDPRR